MFREAERVAKGCGCSAIMVFGDTFAGGIEARQVVWGEQDHPGGPAIPAKPARNGRDSRRSSRCARFPPAPRAAAERRAGGAHARAHQFQRPPLLRGRHRGQQPVRPVVVVDVEREFQTLLTGPADLLPADVKPEVLERVLAVATDLAVEGREGRPVGGLFVVGDTDRVDKFIKPLVHQSILRLQGGGPEHPQPVYG